MRRILAIFQKVWVVYVLLAVFVSVTFLSNKMAFQNARLQTLSRLALGPEYWQALADKHGHLDDKMLDECVFYHRKVMEYVPFKAADAWNLTAFCYYKADKRALAGDAYEKAIKANPRFFWAYYNLGIIAFKDKKYVRAADMFRRGLAVDPRDTGEAIMSSKVYLDVLEAFQKKPEHVMEGLRAGYSSAKEMMDASMFCQLNPNATICTAPLPFDIAIF
ncbi:MAG: tetratricopeptide repeat protein [Candidatus Omnitrophica bacterium]|nr:tetratricopeptide repeat protein [Candidatus Omnitrophota bacterium]